MMNSMVSNSEVMAESLENSRLLSELKYLEMLEPPLTYRICHRARRTIVFVKIDPAFDQHSPNHRNEQTNFEMFERDMEEMNNEMEPEGREKQSFWVGNKVSNGLSAQIGSQCIIFQKNIEENELQEINFSFRQERESSKQLVTFVIILHHDLYPFEPPLITITNWNSFPRIDDFRNYYYEVMQVDRWWPLVTLQDIMQKLPRFASRLNRNSKKGYGLPKLGHISHEHPLWMEDIKQISSGLVLFEAKAKIKNESLVTFFRQKIVGLSYQFIVIVEKRENDELWVEKCWDLSEIAAHTLREGKKHFELSFTWKEQPFFTFKIPFLTLNELMKEKMKLYSSFYSLLSIAKVKEESGFEKRMKIYAQIISHGDWIQDDSAVVWAKEKMHSLAKVHPE